MLTIKKAKEFRCATAKDRDCRRWHNTCRRCELHTTFFSFRRQVGLCDLCYREYEEWYSKNIRKPAIKAFDAEKEQGGQPDWSPFQLTAAYSEWMKQAPHKSRKVIDI